MLAHGAPFCNPYSARVLRSRLPAGAARARTVLVAAPAGHGLGARGDMTPRWTIAPVGHRPALTGLVGSCLPRAVPHASSRGGPPSTHPLQRVCASTDPARSGHGHHGPPGPPDRQSHPSAYPSRTLGRNALVLWREAPRILGSNILILRWASRPSQATQPAVTHLGMAPSYFGEKPLVLWGETLRILGRSPSYFGEKRFVLWGEIACAKPLIEKRLCRLDFKHDFTDDCTTTLRMRHQRVTQPRVCRLHVHGAGGEIP
jgi:hypothetical protein